MASKEHDIIVLRVKCVNGLTCSAEHTAIVPAGKASTYLVTCPVCGRVTKRKNLHVLIEYPPVPFGFQKMEK